MAYKKETGRPLKFKTAEELKDAIDKYFKNCDPHPLLDQEGNKMYNKDGSVVLTQQMPYTMSGLAYALGVTRQTLLNYENGTSVKDLQEEFLDTVSRARHKVQVFAETALFNREMARGAEFSLKNNFGWTDKYDYNANLTAQTLTDSDRELLQNVTERLALEQAKK